MFKSMFKDYIRKTIIEFLNGGPLEEEQTMTKEELVKHIQEQVEGKEEEEGESKSLISQLQIEEALKILELQVPIYINRVIDEKLFDSVITRLHDILFLRKRIKELKEKYPDEKMLSHVDLNAPVKIVIATPGGNVREGMAIYDAMQLLKKDGCIVETIGSGQVFSMGTLLLAGGSKGHRYMTKNSMLMIHNISGGTIGTLPDMETRLKEMKRLKEQFFSVFKTDTDFSEDHLRDLLNEKTDQYLTPSECLRYGVVDKVI